jgi:hypothetical protein
MDKSVKKFSELEHIVARGITMYQNDSTLLATLPRGKVFRANSKSFLIAQYANAGGQSWLTFAINNLGSEIAFGVRDATEEELAEYDHSNNQQQEEQTK